jgi:hypothetical protein
MTKSKNSATPWKSRGAVGGLRIREPSRRHMIDSPAMKLVAELCDEIVRHCQANNFSDVVSCPSYRFLERLSYAIGLVSPDMPHLSGETYLKLLRDPTEVEILDFPGLRRFIHTLWRAERHADVGSELGGGNILNASRSGSLSAISMRINEISRCAP